MSSNDVPEGVTGKKCLREGMEAVDMNIYLSDPNTSFEEKFELFFPKDRIEFYGAQMSEIRSGASQVWAMAEYTFENMAREWFKEYFLTHRFVSELSSGKNELKNVRFVIEGLQDRFLQRWNERAEEDGDEKPNKDFEIVVLTKQALINPGAFEVFLRIVNDACRKTGVCRPGITEGLMSHLTSYGTGDEVEFPQHLKTMIEIHIGKDEEKDKILQGEFIKYVRDVYSRIARVCNINQSCSGEIATDVVEEIFRTRMAMGSGGEDSNLSKEYGLQQLLSQCRAVAEQYGLKMPEGVVSF